MPVPVKVVPPLPTALSNFVDANGRPTVEFFNFLRQLRGWADSLPFTLILTPELFGAKGDLLPDYSNIATATNNTSAFTRLGAYITSVGGGVHVYCSPLAIYKIWPSGTAASTLCTISGAKAVAIHGNGAKLYTDASASDLGGNLQVFRVLNTIGFQASDLTYEQSYTALDPGNGAVFYYLQGATEHVKAFGNQTGGVGFMTCGRVQPLSAAQPRVRDIEFECNITNVYYGLTCSFTGDQVTGKIRSTNGGRAAIIDNARQIDLMIESNHGGPFDDISIAAYGSSVFQSFETQTSQIRIVYKNPNRVASTSGNSICRLAFAQLDATPHPAYMRNIDLRFEVETGSAAQAPLVMMTKSTLAGADTTTRGHRMHNVTIGGYLTGQTSNSVFEWFTGNFNAVGNMAGEDVRNIVVRDLVLDGCNKPLNINADGFDSLILENVNAVGCTITITNAAAGVLKTVGFGASNTLSW